MRARGGIQGGTLDAAIFHCLQQYRYASPLCQQSADGMFASGGAVGAPVVLDRLSRGRLVESRQRIHGGSIQLGDGVHLENFLEQRRQHIDMATIEHYSHYNRWR